MRAVESLDDFFIQEVEGVSMPPIRPEHYESYEVRDARRLDKQGRIIRVLITVKTTPQPSLKYEDTVCVAGIALDPMRWVRLYPIPFRHLDNEFQFKKYDIISVRVEQSPNDPRFESLKVDASSIRVEKSLSSAHGWIERALYVENLPQHSLCEYRRGIVRDPNGPSLGIVTPMPGSFHLEIEPHPGWTPEQQGRIDSWYLKQALPLDEFDQHRNVPSLKAPRLKVRACFACDADCSGHKIGLIDWEVVALQMRDPHVGLGDLEGRLIERFEKNPSHASKTLRIFVGNQAEAPKRRNFEALGLYYPSNHAVANSLTLF